VERPELIANVMRDGEDTPRSAFALLSWRINVLVIVAIVALSALAWRTTIHDAHSMRNMVMGIGQIGVLSQGMMGAGVFLAMWGTMMVAMMLPTVAPVVLAHLSVVRGRGDGPFATLAFVGGYLIVWAAIGVVPLVAYWGFAQWSDEVAESRWLSMLAGATFIIAGAYQFTGLKRVCLDQCQSPLGFVVTHDFDRGPASSFGAGIMHGAACLGCCWAAMTVLLVVGLMNLIWMVALFVLFFAEKNWKHGLALAKVAGAALIVLGIAMIIEPALLPTISQ
jgi:predicted metal-binding membrane protein